MPPRARRLLIITLIIGFAVRVVYVLEAQANPMHLAPQMDAGYHLEWAQSLLAGGNYHPGPFFRAPLYPWFLASLLWLYQGSLLAVSLTQGLLGVWTTWLTYQLSREAFPRAGTRGAVIAAGLVSINWVLIYFDAELLLPTLAIPLQLQALLGTIRLRERSSPRSSIAVGALWGLAALVRPNCLLFVAAYALWALLRKSRKPLVALSIAAGSLIPILPITAYNAAQGDTVLISSQAGINLWIGNNPSSDGSTAVVPETRPDWWGGHLDAIRMAEEAEGRSLRPSEVSKHYTDKAARWALDSPGEWLSLFGHKLMLLVSHRELGNNTDPYFAAHHFSRTMRALPPSFALLFALGITGLLMGIRRHELRPEVPAYLAVYASTILLFFVCARYRAPLLPILAIGAGHTVTWAWAAWSSGRKVAPLLMASLCAALCAVSLGSASSNPTSSAPGHWQLGVASLQAGKPAEAEGHFQHVLSANPDYWYAWRDLGRARLTMRDLSGAESALKRGLELRPSEPWIADLLADVYFEGHRPQELADLGEELLKLHPTHATARYHLARAALLMDDARGAEVHVQSGLSLDPSNFQCLFLDARLRSFAGDLEGACGAITRALNAAAESHDPEHEALASEERLRIGCP